MERNAKEFREQSEQSNRGRTRYGWRYSSELRQLAVTYLEECLRTGETRGRAARKLGVSEFTLKRWQNERKAKGGVRRVEVVNQDNGQGVVLVTPEGLRVEGLSESGLIRVLGQLR